MTGRIKLHRENRGKSAPGRGNIVRGPSRNELGALKNRLARLEEVSSVALGGEGQLIPNPYLSGASVG